MCELFAMSSRLPATITYSLEEFAQHGGRTGPHSDGWGIAYYGDRDARVIRDVDAAADSALVRFVAERGQRSRTVMSHIRRATQGEVALRNTQPFSREVGGRVHLFAHNGDLAGVSDDTELVLDTDRPIGETDSEHAFCALMTRIRRLWGDGAKQWRTSPPPYASSALPTSSTSTATPSSSTAIGASTTARRNRGRPGCTRSAGRAPWVGPRLRPTD
jgi:predicted glutamine amidotransferase